MRESPNPAGDKLRREFVLSPSGYIEVHGMLKPLLLIPRLLALLGLSVRLLQPRFARTRYSPAYWSA